MVAGNARPKNIPQRSIRRKRNVGAATPHRRGGTGVAWDGDGQQTGPALAPQAARRVRSRASQDRWSPGTPRHGAARGAADLAWSAQAVHVEERDLVVAGVRQESFVVVGDEGV